MSTVTVKQLAEVVRMPPERLIEQLREAGLDFNDPDEPVSNEQKKQLLTHLRKSHGKDQEVSSPRRVTLKRKSISELRVPAAGGRAKTVNVEVRKKRTYVKRSDVERVEDDDSEREAARAALEKSKLEREEAERQAKEAREKRAAEEQAKREADEKARLEAEEAARKAAEAQVRMEQEQRRKADEQAREKRKAEERSRRQKPAHGPDTRYGRKELHVAKGKSGKRKTRKRARQPGFNAPDQHGFSKPTAPVVREVRIPDLITVADLAQGMAIKATEVIKEFMKLGEMVTINQSVDQDTAALLVEEMGHTPVLVGAEDVEEELVSALKDTEADVGTHTRPPVVTVMGHVDHGKTSLLDHIRRAKVADGEAGGITQHIGAYHVTTSKGVVSFLDTPGHAAFTAMRARGAQVTDIVILVVAADDGVKPQTKEAIEHSRAAGVPMIVAVNKIDRAEADIDRTKQELAKEEVIPEDWGGEQIFVPVSAKTGDGIDDLLDAVLLQAEVMELKANPEARATGVVVESSLDRGRGPVATVLVKNGTLRQGDVVLCGQEIGRVRAMFNESGDAIKEAGPSIPAVILGLGGVPNAGDEMLAVKDERKAKEAASARTDRERETRLAQQQSAKLKNLFSQMEGGESQTVNLLIKADVQGSVEALRDSLTRLSNDDVQVNVISSGVGGITESDATLAMASRAIVIGFNVRADGTARRIIQENDIDLHYYSVIYDAIDEVKKAISGLLGTEVREQIIGLAEVKDVFRASKFGQVAGCLVSEGVVKRNNPIRVLRDNVVIFEGELESLRRFKDDVDEVRSGTECGIAVKQYNDVKAGDQIECFERIEVARTL